MKNIILCCVLILTLSGCATQNQIATLKSERNSLRTKLGSANSQITKLENDKAALNKQVTFLERVSATLKNEKSIRIEETADVRREVRSYVADQVKAIRSFAEARQLLDYIGSELIDRTQLEGEHTLLVDFAHPMPAAGTLLNGRLYSRGPMLVNFCIVRPVNGKHVIVWMSKDFSIVNPGINHCFFNDMLSVEANDLAGLFIHGKLEVPFDKGTGRTGVRQGKVNTGQPFSSMEISDKDNRTYSFGFDGFLDGDKL